MTTDQEKEATLLLSLFHPSQARLIVDAARTKGYGLVPTESQRETEMLPPGILSFLATPSLKTEDKSALMWGYATLILALVKQPKDTYFYKSALKDAYGLSDEYAERIASKIDTPDPIDGWFNRVLDATRRSANWLLPESMEISQSDKFDTDGGYEMLLIGREVKELALRANMNVGTLAAFLSSGSITRTAAVLESGDPANVDDVAEMIGELYNASTAARYADAPEMGGPLRKIFKGKVALVAKQLGSGLSGKAAGAAASTLVPGGALATNALGKSSSSSRQERNSKKRRLFKRRTDAESVANMPEDADATRIGGSAGIFKRRIKDNKRQAQIELAEDAFEQPVREQPIAPDDSDPDDFLPGDEFSEEQDSNYQEWDD